MTQRNETNFGKIPNCKVYKIVELQEHAKAELLQEGIFFLTHLFDRDVLVMKKLKI